MLTLISDLIFHRADTRNKDELFSVPGVCTYVVSFSSCDSAGRCAASPRCMGQGDSTGPERGCSRPQQLVAAAPELRPRSVCDGAVSHCLPLYCPSFLQAHGRAKKNRLLPSESSAGREGHGGAGAGREKERGN